MFYKVIALSPQVKALAHYDQLVETTKEIFAGKTTKLLEYIKSQPGDNQKLSTQLSNIPALLTERLLGGLNRQIAPILTKEALEFRAKMLQRHNLGQDGDSVDSLSKKVEQFYVELIGHVPAVNYQEAELQQIADGMLSYLTEVQDKAQRGEKLVGLQRTSNSGVGAEIVRVQGYLGRVAGVSKQLSHPIIQMMVSFHDDGKLNPKEGKGGFNDYGAHPEKGFQDWLGFIKQGNHIVERESLPQELKTGPFALSQEELDLFILASIRHHVALAGSALGEHGPINFMYLLKDEHFKDLFSDQLKRYHLMHYLAMVSVCDVASYGVLSSEKIASYLDDAEKVVAVAGDSRVFAKEDYSSFDVRSYLKGLYAGKENFWSDAMWDRIERVITANAPLNSMERSFGYVRVRLEKFISAEFESPEEVKKQLAVFFNSAVQLMYFRNPFQTFVLADKQNPKFFENMENFDKDGLEFILAMADKVMAIKLSQGLSADSLVIIRTGSTKTQGYDQGMVAFYNNVVKGQPKEKWRQLFSDHVSVSVNKEYGVPEIYFRLEEFLNDTVINDNP